MRPMIYVAVAALIMTTSLQSEAQTDRNSYRIDRLEGTVYFCGIPVRDTDIHTFRDLGYGYAKDNRHVYRYGEILEYVDPSTFRVNGRFGPGHGDSHTGVPGPGIPGTGGHHHDMDCGRYHKTAFDVFYNGEKIPDAFPSNFEILRYGYAKDAFHVYWKGKQVKDANPSTFKVLENGYAEDAFNTYYLGRRID